MACPPDPSNCAAPAPGLRRRAPQAHSKRRARWRRCAPLLLMAGCRKARPEVLRTRAAERLHLEGTVCWAKAGDVEQLGAVDTKLQLACKRRCRGGGAPCVTAGTGFRQAGRA